LPCSLQTIRDFIELHHYSHNVNGVKVSYCFCVLCEGLLVGGVLFGQLSTTAWKKFANSEKKVLELRRLVLLDAVGKNAESKTVGWCLRWLKKNATDVEIVVSYADPNYGHSGIIYKASNFEYIGVSGSDIGFHDPDTGKTYHSRALRTKYKGEFKPFVKRLRKKNEQGKLTRVKLEGKHCFIYRLRGYVSESNKERKSLTR
jgi:hypothetical protein